MFVQNNDDAIVLAKQIRKHIAEHFYDANQIDETGKKQLEESKAARNAMKRLDFVIAYLSEEVKEPKPD